ncbi:MAG: PQQ-binding-like beta-propeller repeat protein [Ktedonobacterales bacterium]
MFTLRWPRRPLLPLLIALLAVAMAFSWPLAAPVSAAANSANATQAVSAGDWTTYGFSNARTNYNPNETAITASTAPNLKLRWSHHAAGRVTTQALVSSGVVYWGSWDGYEHAVTTGNVHLWSTYLGTTTSPCGATAFGPLTGGTVLGVASIGTLATVNSTQMLFVGGGDSAFYALNAQTGAILWRRSLGTPPNHFLWSSPAYYNGSIYIGVSAQGDCPLEQAMFVQMNVTTGVVQNTYDVVPNGCTGGSVWGSATIDEAAGTVYFATGNPGSCGSSETFADSLVELNAATFTFIHHWQIPASQNVGDGDFGNTPTLFTATINGSLHNLVGVAGKNGYYYAFDRTNINVGPVWEDKIAVGGACPQCGQGSISPSAWDGATLYIAGGNSTISGVSCAGTVRAVNPATGAYRWQHCMQSGPVLGAVTVVPGVVATGQGNAIIVMSASTGATIFRFFDPANAPFQCAVTIANGMLYEGNNDGNLYAFAP